MWNELGTPPKRIAGASGTVTFPNGAKITHIWAHATSASTVAMPDGQGGTATLPIPASTVWQYDAMHLGFIIKAGGTIVFSSTDGFLVEWIE